MKTQAAARGIGPLGTDSTTKAKNFYTALRDFDHALRAFAATSPRNMLMQAKNILRKLDTIIDACADGGTGGKADHFAHLKIRAQNAKTRAIGPMLQAINGDHGETRPRTRLLSLLGTWDLYSVSSESLTGEPVRLSPQQANQRVALYRLDAMLNASLIAPVLFAPPDDSGDIVILEQDAPPLPTEAAMLTAEGIALSPTVAALRRQNQHQLIHALFQTPRDITMLPPYADAALGSRILAIDGELLTLAMDDLLDMQALGVLSQQVIELHAHLLHVELNGNLFTPADWHAFTR